MSKGEQRSVAKRSAPERVSEASIVEHSEAERCGAGERSEHSEAERCRASEQCMGMNLVSDRVAR